MTLKELLQLGYIPKELPPPFESISFGDKISEIKSAWASVYNPLPRDQKQKYSNSKWVNYSIPKVGLSRRIINIPNPLHQALLAEDISVKWADLQAIYSLSTVSSSKPIADPKRKRAVISKDDFGTFKSKRLLDSFDNLYEVKTDISRFYGTIYTHSIPWLVHTKPVAKANKTDYTLIGNVLDRDLRNCNSGQTVGIPIGPDTSLIVAEVITCMIDIQIQNKLKSVKAFRFIDDYYLYCDNYADAEKAFKFIQALLTEFQLDINEEKTKISRAPFSFDSRWSIELGSFNIRKTVRTQRIDIERFVSLSLQHSDENPKDSVLLFSIQVLKYLELFDENWETYEALILKIGIVEPRSLPVVTEILASNITRVNKSKIKVIIEKLIKLHLPKGHNFEVSWALWMCVEFDIKIKNKMAEQIFASNDILSKLIALDMKSKRLISPSVDTNSLLTELTVDSLMEENWIFTYESIKKGWLTPITNPIESNEYFKILLAKDIFFYRESAKVETFTPKKPTVTTSSSITTIPETETTTSIIISGGGGGSSY
ncbi:RNA-directed DNA polymerase [Myroides odoratimimus]|uniref:RNA-directed DNA polymerase n=1 Tax=Myroides odoratimimus TaxID=76832 RepID=UPI0003545E9E|nr:RNA-directed DNA polymerase [Myroides odoratimimus]EPH13173.1 hypothetical protein HMPREF9713_00908 [Myroides odoratimimus CCUG 12700]MEC4094011.1 RNA-directed DNA polymerase [Myroides odoratimimus]